MQPLVMQLDYRLQHMTPPTLRRANQNSSLVFCTNGILLRMLTQSQGLERVTHLVMDEVHERDCFADFLHIVLRQVSRSAASGMLPVLSVASAK